jgi:hypothetical protein
LSCSIPFEEGGSATGELITDKSHGPGYDYSVCAHSIAKASPISVVVAAP